MSDAAVGWTIIISFFCAAAILIVNPKVGTHEPTISSDKPIKLGTKTWANEQELIADVCRTDPTIRGCRGQVNHSWQKAVNESFVGWASAHGQHCTKR